MPLSKRTNPFRHGFVAPAVTFATFYVGGSGSGSQFSGSSCPPDTDGSLPGDPRSLRLYDASVFADRSFFPESVRQLIRNGFYLWSGTASSVRYPPLFDFTVASNFCSTVQVNAGDTIFEEWFSVSSAPHNRETYILETDYNHSVAPFGTYDLLRVYVDKDGMSSLGTNLGAPWTAASFNPTA